jgi:hypothetical protein
VVSALQLSDCPVPPGEALGVAIADKQRDDWGRLGPQVTTTRIGAAR